MGNFLLDAKIGPNVYLKYKLKYRKVVLQMLELVAAELDRLKESEAMEKAEGPKATPVKSEEPKLEPSQSICRLTAKHMDFETSKYNG